MTDRRSRPRWSQAERYLPPVRLSLRVPVLIGLLAVVVFNVVPARVADGVAAIPSVDEVTAKAQSGAAPCPRLMSFYRVQPAIVEWCIRKPYEGM